MAYRCGILEPINKHYPKQVGILTIITTGIVILWDNGTFNPWQNNSLHSINSPQNALFLFLLTKLRGMLLCGVRLATILHFNKICLVLKQKNSGLRELTKQMYVVLRQHIAHCTAYCTRSMAATMCLLHNVIGNRELYAIDNSCGEYTDSLNRWIEAGGKSWHQ